MCEASQRCCQAGMLLVMQQRSYLTVLLIAEQTDPVRKEIID